MPFSLLFSFFSLSPSPYAVSHPKTSSPQEETVSRIHATRTLTSTDLNQWVPLHIQLTTTLPGRAILAGLNWLSSRPNENNPRSWGRHLYTTRETERLPKVFKIEGRQPPNLCAVEVDVDPLDFMAIDTFRLSELVTAATAVFWGCLMGAAKIGLEYPGEEERGVWAKLNRIEYVPPMLGLRPGLRSFGDGEVGRTEGGERVLRVLRDGSRLVVREGVSVEMRTNTSTLARQ